MKSDFYYSYPIGKGQSFTLISERHIQFLANHINIAKWDVDNLNYLISLYNPERLFLHPIGYPFFSDHVAFLKDTFKKAREKVPILLGEDVADTDEIHQRFVDILNNMEGIVANSQHTYNVFRNSGVETDMTIVPPGLYPEMLQEYSEWDPSIKQLAEHKGNKTYILFFLLHSPYRKGLDLILDAFKQLPYKDLYLVIKSTGNVPVNHDNVINITSFLPTEAIAQLYDLCDMTVVPSRGGCVTPETNITTVDGLKEARFIEPGDKVLSRNGFKEVKKKFSRLYTGKVIKVRCQGETVTLTPEHKVLALRTVPCKFPNEARKRKCKPDCWFHLNKKCSTRPPQNLEWIEAKDLTQYDFLVTPEIKEKSENLKFNISNYLDLDNFYIENKDYIHPTGSNQFGYIFKNGLAEPIPKYINFDENFAKLAGYYLSEGCVKQSNSRNGKPSNKLNFSNQDMDLIDEIERLLKKVFKVSKIHIGTHKKEGYDDTYTVNASNMLGRIFKNMFGLADFDRKLPDWVLKLPKNVLASLLFAYLEGDGHEDEFGYNASSVSKQLIYQLRLICQKIGIDATISSYRNNNGKWMWRLYVPKNVRFLKDGLFYNKILELEEGYYSGNVHDFEVENCHEYDVSFIIHNSFEMNVPEALARGTPTISPIDGCFQEFKDYVIPIETNKMVKVLPNNPIHIGKGPEISIDDLAQKIKLVYQDLEYCNSKMGEVQEEVIRKYNWDTVCNTLLNFLRTYF